jgi:hypothetical protein
LAVALFIDRRITPPLPLAIEGRGYPSEDTKKAPQQCRGASFPLKYASDF